MLGQDEAQTAADLPVLLKLQRKVKELEQNRQSIWEQLDKKEGAQQEKAKVQPRAAAPPSFISIKLSYYRGEICFLYVLAGPVFSSKGVGGADNCRQS